MIMLTNIYGDKIEVEQAVHQVESGRFSAIEVGSMPCEDIVPHNVQACKHRLAVIVGVDGNLQRRSV